MYLNTVAPDCWKPQENKLSCSAGSWGRRGAEDVCIKFTQIALEYSCDSLLAGCFFQTGTRPKERGCATAAAAAKSIFMLHGRPFCNSFLDPRPGSCMLSSLFFPSSVSANRNGAAWLASLSQQGQP